MRNLQYPYLAASISALIIACTRTTWLEAAIFGSAGIAMMMMSCRITKLYMKEDQIEIVKDMLGYVYRRRTLLYEDLKEVGRKS